MLEFKPIPVQQDVAVDGLNETLFGSPVNEISSAPLGTIVSDQEILQDLDRVLKQSEDGAEQAICGCQTSCGCANCSCSSGSASNNPLESETNERLDEYQPNPAGQLPGFDRSFLFSKIMTTLENLSPIFESIDSSYQLVLEMPERIDLTSPALSKIESNAEILANLSSVLEGINTGYQISLEMLGSSNVIEQSFVPDESSLESATEPDGEAEFDFSEFSSELDQLRESINSLTRDSDSTDSLQLASEADNSGETIDSTSLRSGLEEFDLNQWMEQFKAASAADTPGDHLLGFSIMASSFERSAPLANPSLTNATPDSQAVSKVFNQIRLHLKPLKV